MVLVAWRYDLRISVGGNTIGFDWRSGFFFGGWFLTLVPTSLRDVAAILTHAWFVNLSFSVAISLCLVLMHHCIYIDDKKRRRVIDYLILCFFVGLSGTIFSFFTDYGFRYAVPDRDTGNSRFTMPLVPILFLMVSSVGRLQKRQYTEI